MSGLVVIANPHARGLKRHPHRLDAAARRLGGTGDLLAPDGLEALDATARELASGSPAAIAILGGDGSAGRVVTALLTAWGARPLPPIALLGGGTMDTIARSVGVRGDPLDRLADVVAHVQGGRALGLTRRSVLHVDGDRYGFLFGNGLFARYIEAYEQGEPGPSRAAWVLARAVGSALVGGSFARDLTRPFAARIELDGEVVGDGRWLVTAAGTVDDVGLGFRPFVEALHQPGHLASIHIGCTPFQLALQLHYTWRGRPMQRDDVVERVARRMVVHTDGPQPYMMDGDLGQTGPTTVVEVGPMLVLLVPPAPSLLEGPSTEA